MSEWISWLNLVEVIPSVSHIELFRVVDSMVHSRVLFLGKVLLVGLVGVCDRQFTRRVDVSV